MTVAKCKRLALQTISVALQMINARMMLSGERLLHQTR
jgi:hypothetical protein